jgi:hypothetical protein
VTGSLRLGLHLTYREGPLLEKDESGGAASPFYPSNYHSLNYNVLYQILLYSLCDWDKNPASSKVASKRLQKGSSSNAGEEEEDDDDIPQVVKLEDMLDFAKPSGLADSGGPESRKKRAENMKKEGMSERTVWLLREYTRRYGVGEIFALLAYVPHTLFIIYLFKFSNEYYLII